MKCECCHQNEATIHLTQVIDNQVKKLNICQDCAKKNGIDLNSPISITDVLLGLGKQPGGMLPGAEFDLTCASCHMTRAEFKKNARLGCPECYNAFMAELASLIRAMHHNAQHVGKIPARQGTGARIAAQVAALKKELETAINKEQYEQAAQLRDKIRELAKSNDTEEGATDHEL